MRTDRDVPILEYLRTPTLLADPRNHTAPILETIPVPDREDVVWIVIPLLLVFHTDNHPFQYVSEILEPIKQFLEVSWHQVSHNVLSIYRDTAWNSRTNTELHIGLPKQYLRCGSNTNEFFLQRCMYF